uniref:Uncharacterized protein n=1 Tax=Marmota marmota marmota TaxID=9994 RepID=A0A8C6AAH3_MARMA
ILVIPAIWEAETGGLQVQGHLTRPTWITYEIPISKRKKNWMWWYMSLIPVAQEAGVGESQSRLQDKDKWVGSIKEFV